MKGVQMLVFIIVTAIQCTQSTYSEPYLTVDSLMNFINDTSSVYVPPLNKKPPDLLISAEEQIRRSGYPIEVHKIYTEDGYKLTLHRIPGASWSRSDVSYRPKQPILVMHGFLGSSQSWLIPPPNRTFPYILADEGYDVWLGNFRTNYYSRSHLKYSTKDRRFWDISFHEMGLYDLPAMIDHILSVTGFPQVIYVGHSMGTTTFLVMSSLRPEYNKKVMASFLLSPVALTIKASQLPPLLSNVLFPSADLINRSLLKLRLYHILSRNEYLYKVLDVTCSPGTLQPLCLEFIAQGYGEHRENLDLNNFGRSVVGLIAGTSGKVAHHLSQLYNTGEFKFYDYGPKVNVFKYGRTLPPDYPLDRATAPVYIYYGLNDVLMNTQSVENLARNLPNVVHLSTVEDPKFTHLDFLMGLNCKEVIYNPILAQINALQRFQTTIYQFNQ